MIGDEYELVEKLMGVRLSLSALYKKIVTYRYIIQQEFKKK